MQGIGESYGIVWSQPGAVGLIGSFVKNPPKSVAEHAARIFLSRFFVRSGT
jgi:hypothetical protein